MQRIFWGIIGIVFIGLLATGSVLGWQFYHKLEHEVITRFSDHRWEVPSKIYAHPVLLYPGLSIADVDLFAQLERLDYRSRGR